MDHIKKHSNCITVFSVIALALIGLAIRIPGLPHLSGDMIDCYLPWYDSVPAGQGIGVLQNYEGDYGLPYATVLWLLHFLPGEALIKIKLVSVVFEYMTAMAAGLLASYFFEGAKKQIAFAAGFGLTILYPALAMNGAYWGQCDGIYVVFVLLMIWALFKDKPALAFVFLGFAVTSKLQTIFIIPFLILYWYRRRNFSLLYLLIVPVVVEILYIPGMLAGYSPLSPITMYMAQTVEYPQMYMHYPNLWCYFWSLADYEMFHVPVIGWVAIGLALMFSFLMLKGRDLSDRTWISVALWSSLFPVYFLPAMHERYSMIAELVAVIYAIIHIKRSWASAFLWLTISWAVYQPMMMDRFPEQDRTAMGMMIVMIALTIFTVKDVLKDLGADKIPDAVASVNKDDPEAPEAGHSGDVKSASRRITGFELKVLDLFDKHGIWFVAAVVFLIFAYAGMKALAFEPMDVLESVQDNLSLPHTALYVILEKVICSIGVALGSSVSSGIAMAAPFKIFGMLMMAVASVMWMKAAFSVFGGRGSVKNATDVSGREADGNSELIRKCLFVTGFLFLPATVFYPLILGSMDGLCLVLCSAGLMFCEKSPSRESSGKTSGKTSDKASFKALAVPCLLFALAIAVSPAYMLLIFGMIFMMGVMKAGKSELSGEVSADELSESADKKGFANALRNAGIVTLVSTLASLLTGFLAPAAGIGLGTSFAAFGYGFIIQGAVWVPLSVMMLALVLRDYRYLVPLMFFEFGLTMDYGKYVGSVKVKYYVLIPVMVVLALAGVYNYSFAGSARNNKPLK
ncbi:MAG: hypothetical protein K5871_08055 [Lachnospiraceae bacterium]|nr:hypothetical protein [Lachnospiraceae bacterium]